MCSCGDDECTTDSTHKTKLETGRSTEPQGVSRRSMLKGVGLGGIVAAGTIMGARESLAQPAAPAINNGSVAGLPFRALIRVGTGIEIADMRLIDIKPNQVVVRTKGSCACYSIGPTLFGRDGNIQDLDVPMIPNHSAMGVVEAVGSQVRRVAVGDRVVVSGTPQCGQCYQCLHGQPDRCNWLGGLPNDPVAELSDGTGVTEMSGIGGLSEITVAYEEYCIPVWTDLPDEEIAMMGDTFAAGVSSVMTYAPVEGGSDVVVFGAGPVGLAAIQGARAKGAGQIIVVEPIAYRREKATEFGATTVLDPNEDTDTLVDRIKEMCSGPSDRFDSGGRRRQGNQWGADFVIEASGGDTSVPTVEVGPDPTGLLALRQAYDVTRAGGHLTTLAIFQVGEISLPSSGWSISGKHHHSGQMGGMHPMRDTPRIIKMIERGVLDCASVISRTVPLDQAVEGFQAVANREVLGLVVTFD